MVQIIPQKVYNTKPNNLSTKVKHLLNNVLKKLKNLFMV